MPPMFARLPRSVGSFSEKSESNTRMPGDSKKQKSKVPSSLASCRTLLLTMTLRRRNRAAKEKPNLTGWLLRHLLKHGCGCHRDSCPAVGQITEALLTRRRSRARFPESRFVFQKRVLLSTINPVFHALGNRFEYFDFVTSAALGMAT